MKWRQTTETVEEISDKNIIYCYLPGIHRSEFGQRVYMIGYRYFVHNDILYKIVPAPNEKINILKSE